MRSWRSYESAGKVFTRASTGLDAPIFTIEVHISGGLPVFSMVGLPEGAVKESKDWVRSALMNSGFIKKTRPVFINYRMSCYRRYYKVMFCQE